jgi:chaperonin GroEL
LGKLISGSATLIVGGSTTAEILARKEVAVQTREAMRGVIMDGVLPGGGIAYLACQPILEDKLTQATNPDERAAYGILINALEEPLRAMLCNAGYDPGEIMGKIGHAGAGYGFDINAGQVVNMVEAGIFDSATVLKTAVQSAVASAALALTTEVLVHHKKPLAPTAEGPGAL